MNEYRTRSPLRSTPLSSNPAAASSSAATAAASSSTSTSRCSIYPLHPPGSRVLVRIPETDLTVVDRMLVAGSSILLVGAFAWVPLFGLWVYRRWRALAVHGDGDGDDRSRRRRTVCGALLLAGLGAAVAGPHRHPRVGQWLQVRRWPLWRAWLKFVAMEILVDDHTSNSRQPPPSQRGGGGGDDGAKTTASSSCDSRSGSALFAFVPHGIFPFALALGVLPELAQTAFGPLQPVVATATEFLPLVRDLLKWMERVDASRASVDRALAEGRRLALVPGGIAEMFEGYPKPRTSPDEEHAIVRKGFLRLAAKHGVPVVPVYCFGSSKLFRRWHSAWLERISLALRVAICLFYGQWGLPVPFRQRLLYVMGQPIVPASTSVSSLSSSGAGGDSDHSLQTSQEEQVDDMYHQFCEELMRIFDRHKEAYGWGHKSLKLIAR